MSLTVTRRPRSRLGSSLRLLREGTAPTTLVLLPHAGGNPGHYRALVAAMPPQVTVLGVCYPGRLDRLADAPTRSITDLAVEVCADLLTEVVSRVPGRAPDPDLGPRHTAGPIALFGHSMGSYVAAETALRLQEHTTPPSLLMVSGSRAPHRTRPRHVTQGGDIAIIEDATRLDPSSAAALDDLELRELVLPALRSDYAAVENYRRLTPPTFSCPLVSYAGADDAIAPPEEVARWADAAPHSEHRTFPGGHFFTRSSPDLATDIGRRLLQLG